jgi:hypothetical protein
MPRASIVIRTSAAPKRRQSATVSRARTGSSRLTELTMLRPPRRRSAASTAARFVLSTITGRSSSLLNRRPSSSMSAVSSRPAAATDRSTRCAPSSFWARAIRTMPSKSRASRRSRNFLEPLALVRSPQMSGLGRTSRSCDWNSDETLARRLPPGCGFLGGTPSSALARARMCSGVVPQQPPAMFRPGPVARRLIWLAKSSGDRSYSARPEASRGSPALGITDSSREE